MKTGTIITATSLLKDTFFEAAALLITQYNDKGAMGFVINKRFERTLNQLAEFKNGLPFPIYDGGPVDREHLYFIHRRPDIVTGGEPVCEGVFLGGDFAAAVKAINNSKLTEQDVKIFLGYCGWDTAELEAEIEEGSWEVTNGQDMFR
ncbi:putative transcriptional regulator [Filimonas zeae]|uniref:Transcriptional regulator n=1 Tax=Filimonas zeae TaxID=1737353 RepID=A0A917IUG2_9BACT|nr:YqgE/AlgH family protein [Filimonas zeae]MDR6339507.1 putative transcriptional regulator [Filimonas zeae]GGH63302.1 hypothetical protein GCM10011379_14040 [Filimonas zeae]